MSAPLWGQLLAKARQHRKGEAVPASRAQGTKPNAMAAATGGTSVCSSTGTRASRRLPASAGSTGSTGSISSAGARDEDEDEDEKA